MPALQSAVSLLGRAVRWIWHAMFKDTPWVQFGGAAGHHPESLVRLFSNLQAAGVRCRYRTFSGGTMTQGGSGAAVSMVILVHRDDLPKAHEVADRIARW